MNIYRDMGSEWCGTSEVKLGIAARDYDMIHYAVKENIQGLNTVHTNYIESNQVYPRALIKEPHS